METSFKVMVNGKMKYKEVRTLADKIEELGYEGEFIDNGNLVFTKTG